MVLFVQVSKHRYIISSPGLCPWRAYVVTQALASASVGVGVRVRVRVSTMFKFSNVCIVFNCLRYCFHIWPTLTLG